MHAAGLVGAGGVSGRTRSFMCPPSPSRATVPQHLWYSHSDYRSLLGRPRGWRAGDVERAIALALSRRGEGVLEILLWPSDSLYYVALKLHHSTRSRLPRSTDDTFRCSEEKYQRSRSIFLKTWHP